MHQFLKWWPAHVHFLHSKPTWSKTHLLLLLTHFPLPVWEARRLRRCVVECWPPGCVAQWRSRGSGSLQTCCQWRGQTGSGRCCERLSRKAQTQTAPEWPPGKQNKGARWMSCPRCHSVVSDHILDLWLPARTPPERALLHAWRWFEGLEQSLFLGGGSMNMYVLPSGKEETLIGKDTRIHLSRVLVLKCCFKRK